MTAFLDTNGKLITPSVTNPMPVQVVSGGGGGGGGDASAANQVVGNNILADIDANTDNLESLLTAIDTTLTTSTLNVDVTNANIAVTAASLPLPTGASTSALQTSGNTTLTAIDAKLGGIVDVNVVNQNDLTDITAHLLSIKDSCTAIDVNTDAVETKLDDVVATINSNGNANHSDLVDVIAAVQAIDANTQNEEILLNDILNKLIVAPATLAEQQIQSTSLASIDLKTPALIDTKTPVLSMDYGLAVSRGLIAGVTTKSITGYNASATTTLEPVWSASNQNYVWLTGATSVSIASSSATDSGALTGARTVLVNYLKTDFSEVNQIVTLNGITPVVIAADVFRINQVVCLTWGTSLSNAGALWVGTGAFNITTGFANNLSKIEIGENISQQAIYTVPANKSFEALSFRPTLSSPARFRFQYKTAASTGLLTAFNLPLDSSQAFTSPFASTFAAGTDLIVQSQSLGGTIQAGMIISGFLRSV